jgi:RNA polymerase sigma-70 factor, ECF subfamily
MMVARVEFTDLLARVQAGERSALDAAIPLVYAELKKVAANHLRRESIRPLETTALVHETYVKLARHAKKREGITIALGELSEVVSGRDGMLLDVDAALDRLGSTDERKARLIEMRYFGGMTVDECAVAAGMAAHTARRELRLAHAWLHRELASGGSAA